MTPDTPSDSSMKRLLNRAGGWRRMFVLAMLLGATAVGWGATKQVNLNVKPHAVLPAMQAAAETAKMSLSGMAAPERREASQPGDQVTALLTLTEGKQVKQWVVELTVDKLTEAERDRAESATTLFTLSGHQFTYGGGRAALNVRIVGPVDGAGGAGKKAVAPVLQARRITVSADYLALGLNRMAAMDTRVAGLLKQDPKLTVAYPAISETPYPAEKLAAGKARPKTGMIEFTEAEERTVGGAMLALQEFFRTAQRTPGLREVLLSVLDVPWWPIVRSGGKLNLNFNNLPVLYEPPGADWGLSAEEKVGAVSYVLEINGKPALVMLLAVTAPRPPLMAGAGIVGFAMRSPTGKGPVLTMQIVSSRAATPAP